MTLLDLDLDFTAKVNLEGLSIAQLADMAETVSPTEYATMPIDDSMTDEDFKAALIKIIEN